MRGKLRSTRRSSVSGGNSRGTRTQNARIRNSRADKFRALISKRQEKRRSRRCCRRSQEHFWCVVFFPPVLVRFVRFFFFFFSFFSFEKFQQFDRRFVMFVTHYDPLAFAVVR